MTMTGQATATGIEIERGIRGKLVEDLKTVAADAEELLKATASQTGVRFAGVRTKLEESLKAAKVRLAEEDVMAKTMAAAKAAEEYVRVNPWNGVGIAAAIGLVLGILVARR